MLKIRNANEKMMMPQMNNKKKSNENKDAKKNRFLIAINVLGSAGPIRFVVNEDDGVTAVIDTALKSYAREGRLPILGSNSNNFLLYCANAGSDALSPWEKIGSRGGRNFVLCKKEVKPQTTEGRPSKMIGDRKGSCGWRAWLNNAFKISSH